MFGDGQTNALGSNQRIDSVHQAEHSYIRADTQSKSQHRSKGGVNATDRLTFLGATLLLVMLALYACYAPARRAMRSTPW